MAGLIRILFVSDTHLGFDLPFRPRIERRRRGPDFFNNFELALEPALNKEVDCVVHGGDLLFRSKVPAKLVEKSFEPLKKVADTGIPVYLVPGNHERSQIPYRLLAAHSKIHIFHRPQTYLLKADGIRLALAGFPFERKNIRNRFPEIIKRTGWKDINADAYVMCIHQCVEGATVGPKNYTFRYSQDVIRAADIPDGLTALLSGHIHRFQVLQHDLRGNPITAPVFYPGSVERTSFAEKDEKKGYIILELGNTGHRVGNIRNWKFHELPARPMIQIEINAGGMNGDDLKSWIRNIVDRLPGDAVLKLKIHGEIDEDAAHILTAPSLRSLVPKSMNVSVALPNRKSRKKKKAYTFSMADLISSSNIS